MTAVPSMRPHQAADAAWDCVVEGAGIGGLACAARLAAGGARVLVVEKRPFPREKVCGGCLNPRALAALDAAGLGDAWRSAEHRAATAIHLALPGRRRVVLAAAPGIAASRGRLDQALARAAADAGAAFLLGASVRGIDQGRHEVAVEVDAGGERFEVIAGTVVGAGGLASSVARIVGEVRVADGSKVGAGCIAAEPPVDGLADGGVLMAVGEAGYAGVVRSGDSEWIVAAALRPASLAGTTAAAVVERLLRDAAGDSARLPRDGWHACPAITRAAGRLADGRAMLVGDAAGYVEPITGEGMAWAAEAGVLAAECLLAHSGREAAQRYAAEQRRRLPGRQRRARLAAWALHRPRRAAALLAVPGVAGWIRRGTEAPA